MDWTKIIHLNKCCSRMVNKAQWFVRGGALDISYWRYQKCFDSHTSLAITSPDLKWTTRNPFNDFFWCLPSIKEAVYHWCWLLFAANSSLRTKTENMGEHFNKMSRAPPLKNHSAWSQWFFNFYPDVLSQSWACCLPQRAVHTSGTLLDWRLKLKNVKEMIPSCIFKTSYHQACMARKAFEVATKQNVHEPLWA